MSVPIFTRAESAVGAFDVISGATLTASYDLNSSGGTNTAALVLVSGYVGANDATLNTLTIDGVSAQLIGNFRATDPFYDQIVSAWWLETSDFGTGLVDYVATWDTTDAQKRMKIIGVDNFNTTVPFLPASSPPTDQTDGVSDVLSVTVTSTINDMVVALASAFTGAGETYNTNGSGPTPDYSFSTSTNGSQQQYWMCEGEAGTTEMDIAWSSDSSGALLGFIIQGTSSDANVTATQTELPEGQAVSLQQLISLVGSQTELPEGQAVSAQQLISLVGSQTELTEGQSVSLSSVLSASIVVVQTELTEGQAVSAQQLISLVGSQTELPEGQAVSIQQLISITGSQTELTEGQAAAVAAISLLEIAQTELTEGQTASADSFATFNITSTQIELTEGQSAAVQAVLQIVGAQTESTEGQSAETSVPSQMTVVQIEADEGQIILILNGEQIIAVDILMGVVNVYNIEMAIEDSGAVVSIEDSPIIMRIH